MPDTNSAAPLYFVRACAVEMHVDISHEPFGVEIYRENAACTVWGKKVSDKMAKSAPSRSPLIPKSSLLTIGMFWNDSLDMIVVFKCFGNCSSPCYDHFPCPDSGLLRSLYENKSLASNHWRALLRHHLEVFCTF